jgi:hypothetical protein
MGADKEGPSPFLPWGGRCEALTPTRTLPHQGGGQVLGAEPVIALGEGVPKKRSRDANVTIMRPWRFCGIA